MIPFTTSEPLIIQPIKQLIEQYEIDNDSKKLIKNLKSIDCPNSQNENYLNFINLIFFYFLKFENPLSKRILIPILKISIDLNLINDSEVGTNILNQYREFIQAEHLGWVSTKGFNMDQLKLVTLTTLLEFPLGVWCIEQEIDATFQFIKRYLINNAPYNSDATLWTLDPQLGLRALLNLTLKYSSKVSGMSLDRDFVDILINCLQDKALATDINMLAGDLLTLLPSGDFTPNARLTYFINQLQTFKTNGNYLSWLGYLHGMIHLWSTDTWFQNISHNETDINLFEFFFNELSAFCVKIPPKLPSSFLVIGMDLLSTLLLRVSQTQKQTQQSLNTAVQTIITDQNNLQLILNLIFNLWNHSIEALHYKVKNLLEGLLQLYQSLPDQAQLVHRLLNRVIQLEYYSKTKYGILTYLLPYVPQPSECIELDSQFLTQTFEVLKVPLIAPKVGEFIGFYITLLYNELVPKNCDNLVKFEELVFGPLVSKLLSNEFNYRKPISLFILPKLIPLHPQLSKDLLVKIGDQSLPATITILKVIKSLDLPLPLNLDQLHRAIYHADSQVRADLLGLLCETRKTNLPVTATEFELMSEFFKFNLNGAASDFRQKFTAYLTKFLNRVRDNLTTLVKKLNQLEVRLTKFPSECPSTPQHDDKLKAKADLEADVVRVKHFMGQVIDLSISSFYPGSSPHRISSGLRLLNSFLNTFGWNYEDVFNTLPCSTPKITQSSVLFTCLSYMVMNGYEHNRSLAHELIQEYPGEIDAVKLFNWCFDRSLSNRARDSESGAHWVDFLISKVVFSPNYQNQLHLNSKLSKKYLQNEANGQQVQTVGIPSVDFFLHLLHLLKVRMDEADRHIPNNDCPPYCVHGILIILQLMIRQLERRNILRRIASAQIDDHVLHGWRLVIGQSFDLCHRLLLQVEPPLAQKSPEGNEEEGQDDDDDQVEIDIQNQPETQTQFRNLLSYCWRGCKESSTLLGLMVEILPVGDGSSGLLSHKQLIQTGTQFQRMFDNLRHRGAFSSVYPNYLKLNIRLLQSKQGELTQVVNDWLHYHVEQVSRPDLEGTRRSGGLPFGILAVLNSFVEVGDGGNQVGATLDRLIAWARDTTGETVHRVHALNVLKFLLTDAKLGPIISGTHTELGYQLAIDGFGSQEWGIRNSSIMLFTALLNRTFGSKRTRDEHDAVNRITGREFFGRYPYLLPYLINALQEVVDKLESGLFGVPEGLYPILTLLTRLSPSVMDGDHSLSGFKNLVIKCAKSRVFKIREMGAKALAPLLAGSHFSNHILEIVKSLQFVQNQNELHGILLQVYHSLELNLTLYTHSNTSETVQEFISQLSQSFQSVVSWATSQNPCTITRGLFVKIILNTFGNCQEWIRSNASAGEDNESDQTLVSACLAEYAILKTLINTEDLSLTMRSIPSINALAVKEPLIQFSDIPISEWLSDPLQEVRILAWREIQKRGQLKVHHAILIDHIFEITFKSTHVYQVELLKLLLDHFNSPFPSDLNTSILQNASPLLTIWEWAEARVQNKQPLSMRATSLRLMSALLNLGLKDHNSNDTSSFNLNRSLSVFSKLVSDMSSPDKELELRAGVVAALSQFNIQQLFNSNQRGQFIVDFFDGVCKLLQDDDEDIRNDIAETLYTQQIIQQNYHHDKILENFLLISINQYGNLIELYDWFIQSIYFDKSELENAETQLKYHSKRSLFEVEPPNQYIEPIKTIQLSYHLCLALQAKPNVNLFANSVDIVHGWLVQVENFATNYSSWNHQEFGPLGISSMDPMFSILTKLILGLKLISNDPHLDAASKQSAEGLVSKLQELVQIQPLHPLLLTLIGPESPACLMNGQWMANYLISMN